MGDENQAHGYTESGKTMRYICYLLLALMSVPVFAGNESICFGTTDNGRLENGWQLPASGDNFVAYSLAGMAAGRNYVHSKVHAIVTGSYLSLKKTAPGKRFVYGETGWKDGGRFRPHKTHQNGLSVDFFVPVVNGSGSSVALPTNALNTFGYDIEFNAKGQYGEYRIDFDAMADHLLALKEASDRQGVRIWRVIFDNELQKQLFATKKGAQLKSRLTFSTKKPWVRHDEHYHVDFVVSCR